MASVCARHGRDTKWTRIMRPIKLIKEVDLQSKAKQAILDMGGFSMKMSNRFLVGVPDLLCQLPGCATSFWEVKSSNTIWNKTQAHLTLQQKKWLRTFELSGGFGGVIMYVMMNDLMVAVRPTSSFPYREDLHEPWWVYKEDLVALPRGCKMKPFQELMLKIHANRSNNGNVTVDWDPCGYKG